MYNFSVVPTARVKGLVPLQQLISVMCWNSRKVTLMLGTLEIDWYQIWEKVSEKGIQKEKTWTVAKVAQTPKTRG